MKKKIIILGSCLLTLSPLVAISCSTSWQKWEVKDNQNSDPIDPKLIRSSDAPKASFKDNAPKVEKISVSLDASLRTTRDNTTVLKDAYDVNTKTIDLEKINNQFELNNILIESLQLRPSKNIEEYYRFAEFSNFISYFDQIVPNETFILKYKNEIKKITWDISAVKAALKTAMTAGIANRNNDPAVHVEDRNYFVNGNWVGGVGDVVSAGVDMLKKDVVQGILSIDFDYATNKLALLTNFPSPAFKIFKDFLDNIGKFTQAIYGIDDKNIFVAEPMKLWEQDKKVEIGLLINSTNYKAANPKFICDGAFLLQGLSQTYKEVK